MKTIARLLSASLALLTACGGGDGGEDPQPQQVPPPQAATLIFPENNTTCFEGEAISPSISRVTFRWNESEHTDTYELHVRNLNTNMESSQNPSINEATLTLPRGTPFQWYVISRSLSNNQTATSATWRFYNEGPGITNYAPFPAEAVYPDRGAYIGVPGSLTLEWAGADADGDISAYEVFFGTAPEADTAAGTTSETTLTVNVSAGQTYYWKVLTRDTAGNSSESEIFEFRVQ